jgi:hypothetical protein
VNLEGLQDELYYSTDGKYYRVKSSAPGDPPVGTLPTDTTYFEPIDVSDRYILLDQVNQTPIGDVITIFDTDPRLEQYHYAQKLPFRPTEREITLTWAGTGPTVWVLFRINPSEFTGIPFVTGKTYALGDRILHPTDGECYSALMNAPTGDPTAQPAQWAKIPFPAFMRKYVVAGAYADGLRETNVNQPDPVKLQIQNTKVQMADAEADAYLQQEVDRLIVQGQVFRYGQHRPTSFSAQYNPIFIGSTAA